MELTLHDSRTVSWTQSELGAIRGVTVGPIESAVHPGVANAMSHVDETSEPRLERIMGEIRAHRKRVAADAAG